MDTRGDELGTVVDTSAPAVEYDRPLGDARCSSRGGRDVDGRWTTSRFGGGTPVELGHLGTKSVVVPTPSTPAEPGLTCDDTELSTVPQALRV